MKRLLAFFLCPMLLLGMLAGCAGEKPTNEDAPKVIVVNAAEVEEKECYIPIAEETQRLLTNASGSDGRYNYFYVKLGSVRRTPVYYENAYSHRGLVDKEYEWSELTAYETAIETATAKCIENTVSSELSIGTSSSLEASAKFEYAGLEVGAKATASVNLENSLSHSRSDSVTTSTSKTVSKKMETTRRLSYVITKDCPVGIYRYTLYATTDVYAVVVCDTETETFTYTYFSVIDESTLMEELSYFADESFGSDNTRPLSLDISVLDEVDLYAKDLPMLNISLTYIDEHRKTVTDTGLYGIEQQSSQEKLDLTRFQHYMTDGYLITFHITVNIEEKDNGYQELFLYKQDPGYDSKSEDWLYSTALSRGLVAESGKIESGEGAYDKELTFTVDGNNCAKTMYLRYDAQGDKEDTWYRNRIRIDVSAKRK